MCKKNCGNCVEEGFKGAEIGGRVSRELLWPARDRLERVSRMRSGENCLFVLVGRKPVVSCERAI